MGWSSRREIIAAPTYCMRCGFPNSSTDRFCTRCGNPLPAMGEPATGYGPTYPPPTPPGRPTETVLIVLIVAIIAVVVLAGVAVFFAFGAFRSFTNYAAEMTVQSYGYATQYQGQPPTRDAWLVVVLSLRNTGSVHLFPTPVDWSVKDVNGSFLTFASNQPFSLRDVAPGANATFTLGFDVAFTPRPASITLRLPNGDVVAAVLPPKALTVVMARSGDGTNWTLTFTSVPLGLTTDVARLSILASGGGTALAGTAFSALTYVTDRAAYFPAISAPWITMGDRLLIGISTYPAGYTAEIRDSSSILFTGMLQ